MKINALTTNFMGTKNTRNNKTNRPRVQYAQYDTYTRQLTPEEIAERKKQVAIARKKQAKTRNQIIGASKMAATLAALQVIKMLTFDPTPTLDSHGNTLKEAAEYMDVPVKIVEIVNNAEEDDVLDEYIIPEKYNGIDNAIKEYEEELSNEKLSSEKREKIEAKLEDLEERKEDLDEMGEVYIDPKTGMAYIQLNGSYDAEEVKDVLGIKKDGEFRDDASYSWEYDTKIDRHYKDYTDAHLSGIVDCRAKTLNPKHE